MKSTDLAIIVGEDDFEIESESRKQPKGGYMMKETGNHIGSVKNDVLEKWKSITDTEKEPYLTQSKMDRQEYKAWRKAHEKNEVSTRCSIKRVNSLIEHLKENDQLNVLEEMGFGSLIGARDLPIRRELVSCAVAILGEEKRQKCCKSSKTKNWKTIASKYDLKHKVTCAELEEEIKSGSYEGDDLKVQVLLYLVGIFLCPTSDTSPSKDNMKLICDEGLKGEFNWAEYVHSRLIESIISFQNGHRRYLKECIAILEVVLFDFWLDCNSVPAYERIGVAHICAWGKKEVVRVMAKLKLERPKKQERGDDGEGKESKFDILMSELVDVKKFLFDILQRQSRVEEAIERLKGEVDGKIDGVVKEVMLGGELKMVMGGKIDGVVKEVVELRGELTGVKGVVEKTLDEGGKIKSEIKEMKSYVEEKYDELKNYEEKKDGGSDEEGCGCDLYTRECYRWRFGFLMSFTQKEVEKAKIPSGISDCEAYPTLKPMEWDGSAVIDLVGWILCYESNKLAQHGKIGYLPYNLAMILNDYSKFTDCDKILVIINDDGIYWYLLVLDMVSCVATVYDSLFSSLED
ncbi:hypothetical protein F3Y22_tig00110065pilonHSYRG00140 [Hibiscus syriacus]|uniref:HMG box domain-containing protein n=1 Tax=Hibiscus syriacus TaxID=106335 RepID=A0A6A3BL49_HIBSY|nr:hypothetical protein F3Y22_tig00110065pilonHSYRG00140 [Hibiscus syriacus]